MPKPPTRERACSIRVPFQGFYINSPTYGARYQQIYGGPGQVPFFGGAWDAFAAVGEAQSIVDQHKAAGFTHVFVNWGHGGAGYDEPGQPYGANQLIPPGNQTPEQFLASVDVVIDSGLVPVFIVNGEGNNLDILATFEGFVATLRTGYDRTAYGPFLVSYDGVWGPSDAWTVDMMTTTIPWMRTIIGPDGYLGFMFANGPAGNPYLYVIDEGDYSKPEFDGLDIVFTTTGPPEAEGVSLADKAQYMVRDPNFSEFQPSFHGPFIFHDCSRGPRFYLVGETRTYQTVRDPNQQQKSIVAVERARMVTMNYPGWG
jgi:hypothetical protein